MDPAFEGVGQKAGLQIWRIENFEVVPYPANDYGKFYSGDSYVILHTKEVNGTLSWDIHFWLGSETSQDEKGTAAIKAVELDDSLGGVPVQHREVQDNETELFQSYFKSKGGLRYLPGGVASGFRHVDPDAVEKRLFQVKGKRNVRVREVKLDVASMNKGDCFILDVGKEIYVYVGTDSKRVERLRAIQAANQIRDQDHGGRSKIYILDESSSGDEFNKFFQELGSGSRDEVPPEDTAEEDAAYEKQAVATVSLYRVSDAGGDVNAEKVAEKPLRQDMLKSEDCFILDTVTAGLYVWIGKQSSRDEKIQSMKIAEKFLEQKNYPQWTKIQRVVDGGEPSTFKQYFTNWKEPVGQIRFGKTYTADKIAASIPDEEFNVASLHRKKLRLLAKNAGAAFGFMPDDGSGQLEAYRIENFELAPVDPAMHGMFFGGDSYVLKYTYKNKNGRESYIVYFWQGASSTQDEKAASAIHAVRMDDELGGRAVQIRVTQGNEPRHFLRIFKGRMIVFMGGHASGFKNIHEHETYDPEGTRLFHVRGTCPDDVRAVQVTEKTGSLNSDDVFVMETPSVTYVWNGNDSSDEEREFGSKVVELVSPDRAAQVIAEGEEPEEFWAPLGGPGDYQKGSADKEDPTLSPRLFHCWISPAGRFRVEEVGDYSQEDLNEDDMMMLDTNEELYIWVGNGTTPEEKQKTLKTAEEYIAKDPSNRSADNTLTITIKQGEEPEAFKALFPSWDPNMWANVKSYEDIKNDIAEANAAIEDE